MLLNLALLGYVAAQAVPSPSPSPQTQPAGDMATASAPTPTTVQGGAQTPDQSPAVASSPAAGGAGGAGGAGVSSIPTQASTAIPSSTLAPDTPVPGQDTLPPPQWWCADNATYCPGKLLQDVQLSGVFPDSKTFVDKPTNGSLNDTLNAFNNLGTNTTIGGITTFASEWFKGEGLELEAVEIENFNPSPAILQNVTDPIYKAWVQVVHGYWTLLIRQTNTSALCQPGPEGCTSSLIPLNHTIVVPGGRYREIYYWDSYWILQGLLASELNSYALNLLQNFMDLVETIGFLPNGGRKYYLNRSQPPVFAQMVHAYVLHTGNVTILDRALPLLDKELEWWAVNRTLNVTSPWTNKTHTVAHFAVNNSAPRPEGYVEDYETAFGKEGEEGVATLTETQRSDLYAELASGAESGWDYSSRWCREPLLNATDNNPALRTLNVRGIAPVDLNALLASDHMLVAELYELHAAGGGKNGTAGGGGGGGAAPLPTPSPATTNTGAADPNAQAAPTATVADTGPQAPPADPAAQPTARKRQQEPPGADPALSMTPSPAGGSPSPSPSPAESPATGGAGQSASPSPSPAAQPQSESVAQPPAQPPQDTPQVTPEGAPHPSPSPEGGAGAGMGGNSTSGGTGGTDGTGGTGDDKAGGDKAAQHRAKGKAYADAVLDLHWDAERAYFYDYNMTDNSRSPVYSPAGLWPLWLNITPPGLEGNETMALAIASGQRFILGKYAGVPAVASLLVSGLQWDFPNVWPPHVYTTIRAFETLARLVPNATTVQSIGVPFENVTANQLNLNETQLPPQPPETIGNTSLFTNVTEPWPTRMAIEIANRYMTDAFCSWYSTGGSIPGVLQQLPISDLNSTGTFTQDQAGHMFEKFNATDPDAAGGGGEYTVQIGFGWTNGVVLWSAGRYGKWLPPPTCPLIPIVQNNQTGEGGSATTPGGADGNATTPDAGAGGNATAPVPASGDATAGDASGDAGTAQPTDSPQPTQPAMFRGYRIPRGAPHS